MELPYAYSQRPSNENTIIKVLKIKITTFAFLLLLSSNVVSAQLLHPLDLVIGRWGVNLHRKDVQLLESMVFPPNISSQSTISNTDFHANNNFKSTKLKRRKRKLKCDLFLNADGTFVLHPPSDLRDTNLNTESNHIQHLPLKGRWDMRPNPYCVTDRQYDELMLISNPKVRVRHYGDKENMSTNREEKVTLEMNCKVWGRFGSNTIRSLLKRPRGREAAKLTHGTLCIKKEIIQNRNKSNSPAVVQNPRRAICATFNAKTCPNR